MNHVRVHSIPGTLHFYQPRQFYPVHLLQQLTYIQKFISSFTHTQIPSGTASSPDLFPNAPIIILMPIIRILEKTLAIHPNRRFWPKLFNFK